MYKTRRAKATDIPQRVKEAVWERDGHRCIRCRSPYAIPSCHFIARSQGGLGIEQNVVTLCQDCHRRYDQSTERKMIREEIKRYLMSVYKDWSEEKLVYDKWRFSRHTIAD